LVSLSGKRYSIRCEVGVVLGFDVFGCALTPLDLSTLDVIRLTAVLGVALELAGTGTGTGARSGAAPVIVIDTRTSCDGQAAHIIRDPIEIAV